MQKKSNTTRAVASSRQEKLSLLSAILGSEALSKLNSFQTNSRDASSKDMIELDPKRAEWHRNRLMERFRLNAEVAVTDVVPDKAGLADGHSIDPGILKHKPMGIDERLGQVGLPTDLSREHPAVIAHILTKLSRVERVDALKSLPGPVARTVVRRLR
jgi:hypothetical protein